MERGHSLDTVPHIPMSTNQHRERFKAVPLLLSGGLNPLFECISTDFEAESLTMHIYPGGPVTGPHDVTGYTSVCTTVLKADSLHVETPIIAHCDIGILNQLQETKALLVPISVSKPKQCR